MAETVCIVLGISAHHRDEREGVHDQDKFDLAGSQPELSLTKPIDRNNVQDSA